MPSKISKINIQGRSGNQSHVKALGSFLSSSLLLKKATSRSKQIVFVWEVKCSECVLLRLSVKKNKPAPVSMRFFKLVFWLSFLGLAIAYEQFCRCQCDSKYKIIPLQDKGCNTCTKNYCLSLNLEECKDFTEDEVLTTCFRKFLILFLFPFFQH